MITVDSAALCAPPAETTAPSAPDKGTCAPEVRRERCARTTADLEALCATHFGG